MQAYRLHKQYVIIPADVCCIHCFWDVVILTTQYSWCLMALQQHPSMTVLDSIISWRGEQRKASSWQSRQNSTGRNKSMKQDVQSWLYISSVSLLSSWCILSVTHCWCPNLENKHSKSTELNLHAELCFLWKGQKITEVKHICLSSYKQWKAKETKVWNLKWRSVFDLKSIQTWFEALETWTSTDRALSCNRTQAKAHFTHLNEVLPKKQ